MSFPCYLLCSHFIFSNAPHFRNSNPRSRPPRPPPAVVEPLPLPPQLFQRHSVRPTATAPSLWGPPFTTSALTWLSPVSSADLDAVGAASELQFSDSVVCYLQFARRLGNRPSPRAKSRCDTSFAAGRWPYPPKYYHVSRRTSAPPSRIFGSLLAKVASTPPKTPSFCSTVN